MAICRCKFKNKHFGTIKLVIFKFRKVFIAENLSAKNKDGLTVCILPEVMLIFPASIPALSPSFPKIPDSPLARRSLSFSSKLP